MAYKTVEGTPREPQAELAKKQASPVRQAGMPKAPVLAVFLDSNGPAPHKHAAMARAFGPARFVTALKCL
jgi:hypothetical protein